MNLLLFEWEQILFRLVSPIYTFLAWVYDTLIGFAQDSLFTNDKISAFTDSIYVLAGIFVLFRLAVALLNYLINPDSFSDKSTGGQKIIGRVIVSAVLILSATFIFEELALLQENIISADGGIIFRIIRLNDGSGNAISSAYSSPDDNKCLITGGSQLSGSLMNAFINSKDLDATEVVAVKDDLKVYFSRSSGDACSNPDSDGTSEYIAARDKINEYFKSEYLSIDFFLSLFAGVGIAIFLIIMAVDIIVRNLKLLLLQMISPIAFVAYIDPKDKIFNQWLKNYASVFADLFIKLIALAFVVVLFGFVLDNTTVSGFSLVFYILGILVFAKMLPDFISKIFGIDGAGSFKESANMLKNGLGFAAGGAALAVGAGFAAHKANQAQRDQRKARGENFKSKWDATKDKDGNINHGMRVKALGSSALSALGQAGRTAKMISTNAVKGAGAGFKGKGISSTFASAIDEGENLATAIEGGATFKQRTFAGINKALGTDFGGLKKTKAQKEALDELDKKDGELKSKVKDEMYKKNTAGIAESQMRLEAMEQANKDGDYRRVLLEADIKVEGEKGSGKYTIDGVDYDDAALGRLAREKLASHRTAHAEREKATIQAVIDGRYIGDDGKMHTVDIIGSTPELQKLSQELEEASAKAVTAGAIDSDKAVVRRTIEVKTGVDSSGKDIFEQVQSLSFGETKMDTIVDIKHGSESKTGKEYYGAREAGTTGAYEFDHEVMDASGKPVREVNKSGFKTYTDDVVSQSEARAKELQEGAAAAQEFVNKKKN